MEILKRKMTRKLEEWYQNGHKDAFCIVGARQIGKTIVIREFPKDNFQVFIELNFLQDIEAKNIFSGNLDPDTLLIAISA